MLTLKNIIYKFATKKIPWNVSNNGHIIKSHQFDPVEVQDFEF